MREKTPLFLHSSELLNTLAGKWIDLEDGFRGGSTVFEGIFQLCDR